MRMEQLFEEVLRESNIPDGFKMLEKNKFEYKGWTAERKDEKHCWYVFDRQGKFREIWKTLDDVKELVDKNPSSTRDWLRYDDLDKDYNSRNKTGKRQCDDCGEFFDPSDLDEDGLCEQCAEAKYYRENDADSW